MTHPTADHSQHYDALRAWACGFDHRQAGTELLIRTGWAQPGRPWIQPGPWIDHARIAPHIGALSGGQQRLLRLAASILDPGPEALAELLAGMDRPHLELVLAAVAHAAGSRAGTTLEITEHGARKVRVESAYAWPELA